MSFGDRHAAMALRRGGTTLSSDGVVVPCTVSLREHWVDDPMRGQVQVRERCARIVTGSLPDLADEAIVTIENVDYRVRSTELCSSDGVYTDVWIAEETP